MTAVSVLTLVKNRPDHLANLVEGVRRSHHAPNELVIVDMSDEPVEIDAGPIPTRIIRHETTGLPLATARNLAARSSQSPILLFLDVDCIPLAPMVGHMIDLLEREDSLVCANVHYLDKGAVQPGWGDSSLLAVGRPHPVRSFPAQGIRTEYNPGLFWSLAFGIRRSSFDTLGGFDERFLGYGAEDTDFGFRAAECGLALRFLGDAIACHQHHPIYEPPLQHFHDIVANARRFWSIWGQWPMEGWLTQFEKMGLIYWDGMDLDILRAPSQSEVVAARLG